MHTLQTEMYADEAALLRDVAEGVAAHGSVLLLPSGVIVTAKNAADAAGLIGVGVGIGRRRDPQAESHRTDTA